MYETRSSLVEICREEPASSIVIFDTAVPFYQTTRRHIPEDSSPHSRRRENLKSLNPVCFIFQNTEELHLIRTLVIRKANYPDRLGPSGIFVENSKKLTCLEVIGYRIKYMNLTVSIPLCTYNNFIKLCRLYTTNK